MIGSSARDDAALLADSGEGHSIETARRWRIWLLVLLAVSAGCSAALYVAVVLIDPFSTGRFSLTQRVDLTTTNMLLSRVALTRDLDFDGAIISDSSAILLDPERIAEDSRWRIAQLSIAASPPAEQLIVASTFERHHRGAGVLELFVLGPVWCQDKVPDDIAYRVFPDWLYEGNDLAYLSRIFFPDAVKASVTRVAIWLGRANEATRADGYEALTLKRDPLDEARPTEGPSTDAPYPAIDVLDQHVAAMPADSAVMFIFVPTHISRIPVDGSPAAARLAACKQRIRQIATARPATGYLDFMTDSAFSRTDENFSDPVHFTVEAAHMIEPEIARAIAEINLRAPAAAAHIVPN
jgi:hypothetical protein